MIDTSRQIWHWDVLQHEVTRDTFVSGLPTFKNAFPA
jgi:hypothetical protein